MSVVREICRHLEQGLRVMAEGKFISYLRVSTDKQGKSGLGIEAQREAVVRYLNGALLPALQFATYPGSGDRGQRR
jgi:DNA invertase Pin-like site-specific DNA recombinase